MLGKLLKYDFKNLLFPCLPVYLGGLIASIIGIFLVQITENYTFQNETLTIEWFTYVVSNFSLMIILFAITCIILFSIILVSIDFYHTVFAKRGYLIHTLPVSSKEILLSKIISGFISIFLSTIVALSFYYLLSLGDKDFITDFSSSNFMIILGNSTITIDNPEAKYFLNGFFISIVLILIFSSIYTVLNIQLSIALGHLTKYKVVGSIAIFLFFSNFINNLYALPSVVLFVFEAHKDVVDVASMGSMFLNPTILYCLILSIASIVYYFVVRKIINEKLNLI